MTQATKADIQAILKRVVARPIPVTWRSSSVRPGSGERRSFYRGSGYDFEAVEEYLPGDDPRDINWRATAQLDDEDVVLKDVHREPRDIKVFILTDLNPTMSFGTFRATKRHLAAELAACIMRSAEKTQDRVGFGSYTEARLEKWLPTRAPQRLLLPALVNILEQPASKAGSTGSGLVKALAALPKKRSLVFVISDFLHLKDVERLALKKAALLHDVVCLIVQDRRERELPPVWGFYTFQDLRSGRRKTIFVSSRTRQRFRANFERHQEALTTFLKAAHITWLIVSTEEGDAAIPRIIKLFASHSHVR